MRAAKRKLLLETPIEPERVAIIAQRFPYFARLSEEDGRELLGHVQVFLAEKHFEGAGGLEITDEIKLTIAAHACLLLLHRDTDYFPTVDSVLVYPRRAPLAESRRPGVVVLPWDEIEKKGSDVGYRETGAEDGRNVILHELARQLDLENGSADGVPLLGHATMHDPWVRIFEAELDRLARDIDRGRVSDVDFLSATDLPEFFAAVTEAFFETPEKLAKNHPHLYRELLGFFRQDPLARLGLPFASPPPETPEAEDRAPPEDALVVHADVTLNLLRGKSAARLVGVSPRFRDEVLALGCRPSGYLSTLHKIPRARGGHRLWGFVAEVHACLDPSVVAATYAIAGDGVAFWTLLDNGTIIETETAGPRFSLTRFFNHVSPRDRVEHAFFRAWAESPAELYARHLDRVARIAEREHATPVVRDPVELYAACRLHAANLFSAGRAREHQFALPILGAIFFILGAIVLAYVPSKDLLPLALGAAYLVAVLLGVLIALFLAQMRVRGLPRSPDLLFAAAAEHVKHRDVAGIAAVIHAKKSR